MSQPKFNPRVDAYLAKVPPFAQPILAHLRVSIHKGCPDVVEEIKWGMPFFLHDGKILCNLAAFKAHCSLGFWGAEMRKVLAADGVLAAGGMGSLGKITSEKDLPAEKKLVGYVRQAATFIDDGKGDNRVVAARRVAKAPKPPVEVPVELAAALKKNKKAASVFEAFSPSCKREYVEWIAEAKREETRERRIAQAVEWMAEGKQRNWKYQEG